MVSDVLLTLSWLFSNHDSVCMLCVSVQWRNLLKTLAARSSCRRGKTVMRMRRMRCVAVIPACLLLCNVGAWHLS